MASVAAHVPKTKISPATFAKLARRLSSDCTAVSSPVPDENSPVAQLVEADYDQIGLSIANIMKTCAEYLDEAGFEAGDAMLLAERAESEYAQLAARRGAVAR